MAPSYAASTPVTRQVTFGNPFGSAASPPAPPRMAGSNLAFSIGDSRSGQGIENTYHYSQRGNGAVFAKRLSQGRMILPIGNIAATSGFTPAQVRATHYPTAKASAAKTLILLAGVNFGTSGAQDIADVTYMATDWVESASDRVVLVYDEMPPDAAHGWNAAAYTRHVALRDAIRALDDPPNGIYVVPSWQVCTGGNDGNTPQAGFYFDNIHQGVMGGFLVGKELADNHIAEVMAAYDPYAAATFVTGSAPINGSNFAGSTGNAISAAGLNAANTSSSRMFVDGDGLTWAELTLNTSSSASTNPSASTLPANVTPGTTSLSSIIKVKLHAGVTNICGLQLHQIRQSGNPLNTNTGYDGQHPGVLEIGDYVIAEDTVLTLQTPPIVVNAAATSVRWQMLFHPQSGQTITGVVSVARAGMMVV